MSTKVIELQTALNAAGVGPLKVDGIMGPATKYAVTTFQKRAKLTPDGVAGPKTLAALGITAPVDRDEEPEKAPKATKAQKDWPRQMDVTEFYGTPGNPACTAGSVALPVAMRIAWNLNQSIRAFPCHAKVADAMTTIFAETVKHYGEAKWRDLGLDLFGGCYNLRKMRGGNSFSMHSWGIAVDIDPARNQLNWGRDRAQLAKPEYEPFWKIVEGQGALSLGRARNFDWMHFQFARL